MKQFLALSLLLLSSCLGFSQTATARPMDWTQCRFPNFQRLQSLYYGPLSIFFVDRADKIMKSPDGPKMKHCIHAMLANGEFRRFIKETGDEYFDKPYVEGSVTGDYDHDYQTSPDGAFTMLGSCAQDGCSEGRLHVYLDKNGEMQAAAFQGTQVDGKMDAQHPDPALRVIAFVREPSANTSLIQFIRATSQKEIDDLAAAGDRRNFGRMWVFDADSTDFSHHIDVPTGASAPP